MERDSTTATHAFNSLSRDHLRYFAQSMVSFSPLFQLPLSGSLKAVAQEEEEKEKKLSTPSLGITGHWLADTNDKW
jgi:hypothetical protein